MADSRSSTSTIEPTGSTAGEQEHPLAETASEATDRAGHLIERTAEVGFRQADAGINQAAKGVETVAQTIRRVSTDMQTEQPQVADIAGTAADRADDLARYLRETDVRQIIGSVEQFARRQPLLFLGGAFVAGVAASRFLKAATSGGSSNPTDRYGQTEGYGSTYRSGVTADYRSSGGFQATGPGGSNGSETSSTSEGI